MGGAQPASGIKVLVADDQRVNQIILESFLRKEGHTVVLAADGEEAVRLHRTEHPDLVLLDIMMPGIDGLAAAQEIRSDRDGQHTPIIFLTAVTDQETMIRGLGLGDDFIAKPVDIAVLRAKLRAFIRLVQIQRALREQQQRIEQLNEDMRREGEIAAHVLARVLAHTEAPDGRVLQYRVIPSAVFSGDMVLARRTPSGRLNVLLADAVGHGLPAAINILPLFFPFDGMSRKGCSISMIARELNRRVRDLLPLDRFVAATLISVDPEGRELEVWNAANPPALVVDADGGLCKVVSSTQMALGLIDDNPAAFEPEVISCPQGGQVLVCSDGLWENSAFAGADTAQRIVRLMAATPDATRLTALFDAAVSAGQTDDLSAVLITAQAASALPMRDFKDQGALAARLSLQFGPESLRRGNAVDSVLDMVRSMGLSDSYPDLPVVLEELFANALDHGVLGLESAAKYRSGPDYMAYSDRREQRLSRLQEGFVTVELEQDLLRGRRVLRLTVADSGAGFDWKAHKGAHSGESGGHDGRGLQLVRARTESLSFSGQGSVATALIAPGSSDAGSERAS